MKDNVILISLCIAYVVFQAGVGCTVYAQVDQDGYKSVWRGITVFDLVAFFPALIIGSIMAIKIFKDKQ